MCDTDGEQPASVMIAAITKVHSPQTMPVSFSLLAAVASFTDSFSLVN